MKHVNYTLSRLASFLGDTDFEKATTEQLMAYFKTIKSDSTFNIAGSIIRKFLGWLIDPEDGPKTVNMKQKIKSIKENTI